ncbi:GPW/gp25 family protein [Piscirickettsia litoralis]|uniref:Phage baseplate protein n=1 Tax=Piscirickettsia litoralis TaxID=1891921 RepID=A0ABX3A2E9_9GAMM|nr:GPW/gp25 family protein [Piscirickettsia litoralis]ODN41555.1 phage baseplate protein [Piscirickettsia litoralis]
MKKGMNRQTGKSLSGLAHLKQSINDILTTRIGSRANNREYGSNLPNLLDAPLNNDLTMEIYMSTVAALNRWEPRFKTKKVEIIALEQGKVTLTLYGEYVIEGQDVTIDGIQI